MRRLYIVGASALISGLALSAAYAEEVKIGVVMGFTGPVESMIPAMASGAELAMKEASDSGKFLDGSTITPVRADSTCIDNTAAVAATERLVTSDGVKAIVGGDCSGVTGAMIAQVALPNGIVMISPSATSPGLSTVEDNGL
ncbi:MAG TPA: branched-chain amino acid ABC transporter substrate-binding protein, partial [Aliiroseovarius sp.]|nr:branched-chain amino acid ABC transporter substrate-binding protein [Aliiroseovarius sp.]